jgi:hypothetical protein
MGQQVYLYSKLKLVNEGVMKLNFKKFKVIWIRLETGWSSHEQVEDIVKYVRGLNPHM